jgi:ribonuclease D
LIGGIEGVPSHPHSMSFGFARRRIIAAMEKLPPPAIIDRAENLSGLLSALRDLPRIGVDTESNSLYVYRERVCLLQISTPDQDYLVDPFKLPDLSGLKTVFENPRMEKVFHAAEYDLICLRRDFGFRIRGLFDTHAAARSLGIKEYGLNALLIAEFGVKLDKTMQRANWGKRPLPDRQIEYARFDTHYLIPLRDRLAERVYSAGYQDELRDEFERLENLPELESEEPDGDPFWRLRGMQELAPAQRAVLLSLFEWRENEAQKMDRPPFHILPVEVMTKLAREAPNSLADLANSGLNEHNAKQYGKSILQAVERGKTLPPPKHNRNGGMDDQSQARLEALRKWRKKRAEARGVESDVILCRDAMFRIARHSPQSIAALSEIPGVGAFRLKTYGAEILAALNGSTHSG